MGGGLGIEAQKQIHIIYIYVYFIYIYIWKGMCRYYTDAELTCLPRLSS